MDAKKPLGRPQKPRVTTGATATHTIRNIEDEAMTLLRVYAAVHHVTIGEAISVAARNLAGNLINK